MFSRTTHCGFGVNQQKCHGEARRAFAQEVGLLSHAHFMPTVCKGCTNPDSLEAGIISLWQGVCVKKSREALVSVNISPSGQFQVFSGKHKHIFFPSNQESSLRLPA